jgi:anti-anti-sigma factor
MTAIANSQNSTAARNIEHQVLIDLSDLSYAATAELSLLIKTLQRVERCGVKIALGGLQEDVRRVLEITQLDRIFPIEARGKHAVDHPGARVEELGRKTQRNLLAPTQ